MGNEQDPPGEFYKLKPREFERANEPIRAPVQADMASMASAELSPVPDTPLNQGDGDRICTGEGSPTGTESPVKGGNNVHEMLRLNLERDRRMGWFHVKPGNDKTRRRRALIYWTTLVAVDFPLALIAWRSGHTDPFPFVLAMAGIAYFTARLTWETWFLRTD